MNDGNSQFDFDVFRSDNGINWKLYSNSAQLQSSETIIPPFGLGSFQQIFSTIHGAALCTDAGFGIVLTGESLAGKTTLMLSLLQLGMKFITDDIVVIEYKHNKQLLHPFTRPIGIRENTAKIFNEQLPPLALKFSFNTPYGKTYPVHINDLPWVKCDKPVEWKWTVILGKTQECESQELGSQSLSITTPNTIDNLDWIINKIVTWLHEKGEKIG